MSYATEVIFAGVSFELNVDLMALLCHLVNLFISNLFPWGVGK